MLQRFEYEAAYRQGEVLFFKLPKGKKITHYGNLKHIPNGVIRVGEKEGHEHKAVGGCSLDMFADSTTSLTGEKENAPSEGILKAMSRTKITHPEHATLNLPKGEYVVKTQKEAVGKHGSTSVKD